MRRGPRHAAPPPAPTGLRRHWFTGVVVACCATLVAYEAELGPWDGRTGATVQTRPAVEVRGVQIERTSTSAPPATTSAPPVTSTTTAPTTTAPAPTTTVRRPTRTTVPSTTTTAPTTTSTVSTETTSTTSTTEPPPTTATSAVPPAGEAAP